ASFEVTYIILLAISRIVHEKGECRRAGPGLGRVVELEVPSPLGGRRLDPSQDALDRVVQLRRFEGARVLGVYRSGGGENLLHSRPLLGGDVEPRHEIEERILAEELRLDQLARLDRILHQIPLVEDRDESLPLLLRERAELGVLLRRLARHVDDEKHDVRAGKRTQCTGYAIELDRIRDLPLAPQASRVDDDV